jgi:hypothetical protein
MCLALKLASPRSPLTLNGFDGSEDSGEVEEVWSIAFENV